LVRRSLSPDPAQATVPDPARKAEKAALFFRSGPGSN